MVQEDRNKLISGSRHANLPELLCVVKNEEKLKINQQVLLAFSVCSNNQIDLAISKANKELNAYQNLKKEFYLLG